MRYPPWMWNGLNPNMRINAIRVKGEIIYMGED